MRYRERAAEGSLCGLVEAFWTLDRRVPAGESYAHRVLPDGCFDLIFDLGTPVDARVVGTMARACLVRHSGPVSLLGVRFRPGSAPAFIGESMASLVDEEAFAAELGGPLGVALRGPARAGAADELHTRLLETPSFAGRVGLLEDVLVRCLQRAAGGADPVVLRSVATLDRAPSTDIATLAGEAGVSVRQLERRFASAIGLPPVGVRRIRRLARAVDLLLRPPRARGARGGVRGGPGRPTGASVAQRAGFFDQAHMIRDFGELAGVTPTALIRERAAVTVDRP